MPGSTRISPRLAVFLLAMSLHSLEARPSDARDAPGATIISGHAARLFLGRPTSSFRVYAWKRGRLELIPFQVDERDHADRWVIDRGPHKNPDPLPGVFDDNDAIVFMNRDLGERAERVRLPVGADLRAEIRIGPQEDPLGWVYAASFASPPPLATKVSPYQRYDFGRDLAYAQSYALAFDGRLPTHIGFVDSLGELGANTISAVRAYGEARILGGLLRLARTEKDIHAKRYGYHSGPVRTIRRAQYWIALPLGFKAKGKVDLIFYRDFVEGAAVVKIKIPPRLIPADGDMTAYFDFRNLSGARLLADGGQPAEPVDGNMSPAERTLSQKETRWAALILPDGRSFLLAVRLGGALANLEQRVHYRDPVAETSGDGRPSFGFKLSHANRLETGAHQLTVVGLILETTEPDAVREAAKLVLSPPAVEVTPLGDS